MERRRPAKGIPWAIGALGVLLAACGSPAPVASPSSSGSGSAITFSIRPLLCFAPLATTPGQSPPRGVLPACAASSQLTASNLGIDPDSSNVNGYTEATTVPPDPQFAIYPSTTPEHNAPNDTVLLPPASSAVGTNRYVLGPAGVTGTDVASASAQLAEGQWVSTIVLTDAGSRAFDRLARQQFHALIGFDLDGRVVSAPVMQPTSESFTSFDGKVQVAGGFSKAQATRVSNEIMRSRS